jgi:hypothetical protein
MGNVAARTFTINGGVPGAATLLTPTGTITTTGNPQFTFTPGADTTWHHVVVHNDPDDGTKYLDAWYDAATLGCEGGGTCTLDAGLTLANGTYLWNVESYGPIGTSVWATAMPFVINRPASLAPTALSPDGFAATEFPEFVWDHASAADVAEWYNVVVLDSTGAEVINEWFDATIICSGTTCSTQAATALPAGQYSWAVQPWGSGLMGTVSNTVSFIGL